MGNTEIIFKPNKRYIYSLILFMLIIMAGTWFFMGYRSSLDGESNNSNTIIVSIIMVAGIIFYVMYPKIQLLFR
ncbi:MAG: hypothetical protein Q8M94_14905, partial [Ignavibacteria bacterium]|nr:hypothetical protein [Ignavibacteria bacterium]